MRLVKLLAPEAGCTFRDASGTAYAVGEDLTVDVPESMVADLIREGFRRAAGTDVVLFQGPRGASGIDGKDGARGARGPEGPAGPIGPMPSHEWRGTELRFELDVGVWGEYVDLQGPPGKEGGTRFVGGVVQQASTNSYFPAGW
jgi:hypothetical protein